MEEGARVTRPGLLSGQRSIAFSGRVTVGLICRERSRALRTSAHPASKRVTALSVTSRVTTACSFRNESWTRLRSTRAPP
jgi:hypothetical protein